MAGLHGSSVHWNKYHQQRIMIMSKNISFDGHLKNGFDIKKITQTVVFLLDKDANVKVDFENPFIVHFN